MTISMSELIESAKKLNPSDPEWDESCQGRNIHMITLNILGDTDLIMHKWSDKELKVLCLT